MIIFSATSRASRRTRKVPSVAAVVRALGTVRITDRPLVDRPTSSPSGAHPTRDHGTQDRTGRHPTNAMPCSG